MASLAPVLAPHYSDLIKELTPEIVRNIFTSKEARVFWHFVVNTYHESSVYSPQTITQRTLAIIKKIGNNSFQLQDDQYKMTPLHVAAITGNKIGIHFLFSQYVDAEIKDCFGKKASDYVRIYHPELITSFSDAGISRNLDAIMTDFYRKSHWIVKLSPLQKPYRQHTQDFGVEITSLLVASPMDKTIQGKKQVNLNTIHDISLICSKLGIKVVACKHDVNFYPRDRWVRSIAGDLVEPYIHLDSFVNKLPSSASSAAGMSPAEHHALMEQYESLKATAIKTHMQALDSADKQANRFKTNAASLTTSSFLASSTGDVSITRKFNELMREIDVFEIEFGKTSLRKKGSFHFDGGNVFISTNSEGKPQALLGRAHYLSNCMLARSVPSLFESWVDLKMRHSQAGKTKEAQIDKMRSGFKRSLLPDDLQQELATLYSLEVTGLSKGSTKELALACREHVIEFMLQKKLCQSASANAFDLSSDDLHYISQADYHLDTFMKPGPNHSIFLQDYRLSLEVLLHLKSHAKELEFTKTDLFLLEGYIQTASRLNAEIGPLLNTIRQEIERAKFTVLSTPAIFIYESQENPENAHCINFINGLSGWSSKISAFYYITMGCQTGDRLGKSLRESFSIFLKQYVPDIKVHFTGRDPKNLDDFSETMYWAKTPSHAGLHCFTFEIDTKSYP